MKHLLIFLVAISLIFLLVGACSSEPTKEFPSPATPGETPVTEIETPDQSDPEPLPTPEPEPQTFEPIIITGSSDKTSPPFEVTTDEWIIDWSYETDEPEWAIISLFVYPRGETASYVESVLFPEETSGSTYSYAGPGEYYIKVATGNIVSWEIVISPAE